jgi:hypothetical protein
VEARWLSASLWFFPAPPPLLIRVIRSSGEKNEQKAFDEESRTRLIRYKTSRYLPHEQRARIRFLYNKVVDDAQPSAASRATSTTPASCASSTSTPASTSNKLTANTRAARWGPPRRR